jgi:hypothetical protein
MALEGAVRAVVAAIDKDQAVVDVKPLAEHLHGTTQQRRFDSLLFAGFAGSRCCWPRSGCTACCRIR